MEGGDYDRGRCNGYSIYQKKNDIVYTSSFSFPLLRVTNAEISHKYSKVCIHFSNKTVFHTVGNMVFLHSRYHDILLCRSESLYYELKVL